ncbi:MAG: penicillin acylase family protein [Acetobacteraceae bacterium]|nr:penicillin acylase family protein [Acetobacteraceae bacterium]
MRSVLRVLTTGMALVGGLVLLAVFGIAALVWSALPSRNGAAAIPGLSAPVEISFDQHGIPFIKAANLTDAAAALGYVHARDRMFQMELMRRVASGTLSEVAGPGALPIDKEMRTLGLRRSAEADYSGLTPGTQKILEAYAAGVNAWIGARGRFSAPEFLLFGRPAAWQPVDSLLWAKTMGLWLSMNWRQELARWSLRHKLSPQELRELWPPQHDSGQPSAMRELDTEFAAIKANLSVLADFPAPFTQPDHASNEWAVDGSRSETGAPLLAGDPHLGFGFPSLWYLARIDTPEETLVGATAPGVPGLVLGRNSHIAWTFTTTGADVQDVFIETPVGEEQYQTPEGPKPFLVRKEVIKVRGEPDVTLEVRETRHGPVISDLIDPRGPVLTVQMANLAAGDISAEGLMALNTAKTVGDAGKAAALISSPVQNLLVADKQKIALYVTGRVPIRKSGDGFMPVDGASGKYDWVGFASGDQLPHEVAPGSGRLVNANERVAPADFPVFMGLEWFGNWRAQRIRELLSHSEKHTVAGFAAMQVDTTSLFARQILPALLSIQPPSGTAGEAFKLLSAWDGRMAMDQPQPLIFQAWVGRFYTALMNKAGVPLDQARIVAPQAEFVAAALLPGGAHWCGGDCAGILSSSLEQAVADLSDRFGPDPGRWQWGEAHQAEFLHPFLRAFPWLRGFAALRIAVPGSGTTIFATGSAGSSFTAVHGPEYRGVYDLSDLDRSVFMMTPGESGELLSSRSRDLMQAWRDGQTFRLGKQPEQVGGSLRLTPEH